VAAGEPADPAEHPATAGQAAGRLGL